MLYHIWDMIEGKKLVVAKQLLEEGKIITFEDIFIYVSKKAMSLKLGVNYSKLRRMISNPGQIKYSETHSIAKLLQVEPSLISTLIHNQINSHQPKPKKAKPKPKGKT